MIDKFDIAPEKQKYINDFLEQVIGVGIDIGMNENKSLFIQNKLQKDRIRDLTYINNRLERQLKQKR